MRGEAQEITADIFLKAPSGNITRIEIEILLAVARTGSQNKAAALLGISVPVLNKRVAGISKKLGAPAVAATPLRTDLSEAGRRIVETYLRACARMKDTETPVIGASPLMGAALQGTMSGRCNLCISNDELNMSLLRMGILDMAVIDDPEMLMGLSWEEQATLVERMVELGTDELMHFKRGPRYIRLAYGAQGLGFRYLDRSGARYEITQTTMDPGRLFASGLSFFLNRRVYDGLERGKGRRANDAGRIKHGGSQRLEHTITAVILKRECRSVEDSEAIGRIIGALQAGERPSTA